MNNEDMIRRDYKKGTYYIVISPGKYKIFDDDDPNENAWAGVKGWHNLESEAEIREKIVALKSKGATGPFYIFRHVVSTCMVDGENGKFDWES